MARYKTIDTSPRFLAVDLERQLLPGTFEHALNYLVDHELDLRRFDARYEWIRRFIRHFRKCAPPGATPFFPLCTAERERFAGRCPVALSDDSRVAGG